MDEKPRLHYCRLYSIEVLRRFPFWSELAEPGILAASPSLLSDTAFIWSDFRVTATPFHDSQTVYDGVDPRWREFCEHQLGIRPDGASP